MHLAVDVQYAGEHALAAGILFPDYRSTEIAGMDTERSLVRVPYESGAFYLRELPPLLGLVRKFPPLSSIVIDGYVWLGRERPGLGARLYDALGRAVPVIGVAKRRYAENDAALPVLRGTSLRPLYITSEGIGLREAAECITIMAGPHRIPTLLRAVDRLSRGNSCHKSNRPF